MSEIEHGTIAGYRLHHCLCDECRTANREDWEERHARLRTSSVHGTESAYFHNDCRCDRCVAAHREHQRELLSKVADDRHGGAYPYKLGCRCDRCVAGQKARYAANVERGIPEDDPRHGTSGGYEAGCRCQSCKDAKNESNQRSKRRHR